ncbi:hypothetical protein ACCQ05_13495 [Xanthomonas sp. NCPPB 3582]|uniref:hypothetical protein n=1 Tax=Xanthomonas sp. NCPPB 3582 TaxID=487557 RepID=UPI0035566435
MGGIDGSLRTDTSDARRIHTGIAIAHTLQAQQRTLLRFPIPDSRFPIPDSRIPNPESRIPNPEIKLRPLSHERPACTHRQ